MGISKGGYLGEEKVVSTADHRHRPGNIGQDVGYSDKLRREATVEKEPVKVTIKVEEKPVIVKTVDKLVVRIIQRGPISSLIEWRNGDTLVRGWIPNELIDNDQRVELSMLGSTIPYGLPLSQIIGKIELNREEVIEAFHQEGLWTASDFQKNPQSISRALTAACGLSASKIQSKIREFESNLKEVK